MLSSKICMQGPGLTLLLRKSKLPSREGYILEWQINLLIPP